MAPGQLSSLTTYGVLAHAIHPATTSGDTGDTSSGDSLANTIFTPSSTLGRSDVNSVAATPRRRKLGTEGNTHHTGSTHCYDTHGKVGAYNIAPQTTTFEQLARERGVREWNNAAFDDRWLLQPDELARSRGSHESSFSHIHDNESDDPFSDSPSKMSKAGGFSTYWGPTSQGTKSLTGAPKNGLSVSGYQQRRTQKGNGKQLGSSFNSATTRSSSNRERIE